MNIYRIGEMHARPESIEIMRDFLISIMDRIRASQGCTSVQLYQSHDDPAKFTMIEVWESIESHQVSVKNISPDELAKIRPMLASAPSGRYFELVSEI